MQESARAELVAREANRRPPTRQQLKRLAENRADRVRLSLAMEAVEQLRCLQTGQEQARRLSYDEAKGIIQDLHPERTEDAESLPCGDMDSLPPGLELTLENVLEGFQRIDVSSAAGSFTGWTNGVIKSLVLSSHDADRTELLEAFRDLGNGFCAGTVSRHVAYLWAISRAVLVDKPNGGHCPLGIGEDWYRAFARTVARATAAKAGEYLSPLQLGTGVSGGVEIAARMTRLAPQAGDGDTPIALLSLDQKNAFNTSRRDNILGGFKDGLPELCRLFVTFHSFSSELRSGTGRTARVQSHRCPPG